MKVKRKWKRYVHQIALMCLLICYIVICVPQTVKAEIQSDPRQSINSFSIDFVDSNKKDCVAKYTLSGSSPIYLWGNISNNGSINYQFISKDKFTFKYEEYVEDKLNDSYNAGIIPTGCNHFKFYSASVSFPTDKPSVTAYIMSLDKGYELHEKDSVTYDAFNAHFQGYFLNNEQIPEYIQCEMGDDSEGGINNPIEDDEEIGIPIITKRRYTTVYHDTDMGNASDGKEDIDDSQFIFDWSNKTSTGFNLKKNKYHMTRIQIKVQSKCVVYSGFSHKTVKKRFDNYGEMSSEIKSALVDDTPYSIEYGTVKNMLPKTFSEKHNPLYVGRNFTFYFRVMCNESASGTGKWHCGAWRAVGLNASTTQDQTDESSNGHIDSDGNYTKDPDDGYNNSDSDSSTVDDKEDAKDQFKDDQKNGVTNGKNNKSFGWDDFKNLINECKQVPDLIKSVFSFLPDWVLVFIAIGFGIWIFVLIKRAIV